jgi:hypothetical protein
MKISKQQIEQLTYQAYKKIILEQVQDEDGENHAAEIKNDKIKKLAELGKKIEEQIQNSLTHLNAFMNLGIKTEDTFEFKRAVAEIGRILRLTTDYQTVITKAHEIAEGAGDTNAPVNELTTPEQHQLKIARKTLKMNPAMANVMGGPSREEAAEIIKKLTGKSPESDDAEVLNKRPDMKHAYEADTKKPVPKSPKTCPECHGTGLGNNAEPCRTCKMDRTPDEDPRMERESTVNEKIDFVKDAEGKPIRVRDRVIQKAFDPKAKTYKWSMMDKYRVEKILGPNQIIVHDFNSEKDFPLNPTTLKRIGIEHLYEGEDPICPIHKTKLKQEPGFYKGKLMYCPIKNCDYTLDKSIIIKEYGVVIVPIHDEKSIITEDVKAGSLKEAIRILGMKYPANAFKITNIIESTETCSNCNHQKSDHDEASGYCHVPGCHCTDFED